ncbi:MAG: FKBP-type peptidyl-prolyl cis-trans isomerase [Bacteroidota bacterium]
MKVSKNSVVQITYTLREGSAEGAVVEVVQNNNPLTFLFGVGSMLPAFENNLDGLAVDDEFQFMLNSGEAYGDSDPKAIFDVDINIFRGQDGNIDEKMIALGNIVSLRDEQNRMHRAKVLGVTEQTVKLDFNHPMAGKSLHFTGIVVGVREATEEEIANGNIQGPGGSNH